MTKKERETYSLFKWAVRKNKEGKYPLSKEKLEFITNTLKMLDSETNMGYDKRVQKKGKGKVTLCTGSMSPNPIRRKGYKL